MFAVENDAHFTLVAGLPAGDRSMIASACGPHRPGDQVTFLIRSRWFISHPVGNRIQLFASLLMMPTIPHIENNGLRHKVQGLGYDFYNRLKLQDLRLNTITQVRAGLGVGAYRRKVLPRQHAPQPPSVHDIDYLPQQSLQRKTIALKT
jgi:hypothetical protein